MFFYTGKDQETGEELKKQFNELNDARDFADEHLQEYPNYEVYDEETDNIIYSTELDEDVEATAMENMFPNSEGDDEDF